MMREREREREREIAIPFHLDWFACFCFRTSLHRASLSFSCFVPAANQSLTSSRPPDPCDQWFSSDINQTGTFHSLNYPLPYPADIRCSYHFVGRGKERVQVIFQEFDLHKVEEQHQA